MAKIQVRKGGVSKSPDAERGSKIYLMRIDPDGTSSWEAMRVTLNEAMNAENDRAKSASPQSLERPKGELDA